MNHNESLCHYDEYNMLLGNALAKLFEFSYDLALSFNLLCFIFIVFLRGLSDLSKHCM